MENKNYTPEMEQTIRENSPITYDLAVILAERFGKKLRSVIAKACSMEDVEYLPKEKVSKNGSEITRKSEIVERISKAIKANGQEMKGLEKATKSSLNLLMERVDLFKEVA